MMNTSRESSSLSSIRNLSSTLVLISLIVQSINSASTSTHSKSSKDEKYSSVECSKKPIISPEHWQKIRMDEFIQGYPSGNSLSFPQYVDGLNLNGPFECGLGKRCDAPKFCRPLVGPDYYILFAMSQWNYYVNSLYTSLTDSIKACQAIIPEVLSDFLPDYNTASDYGTMNEMDLMRVLLAPIDAGGPVSETFNDTATPDWLAAVSPIVNGPSSVPNTKPSSTLSGASMSSSQGQSHSHHQDGYERSHNLVKRQLIPPPIGVDTPILIFNSSAPVEKNLDDTSNQFENLLSSSIDHKIESGISTQEGIYSSLIKGRFLVEKVEPSIFNKEQGKKIISLISLGSVLKSQNVMVLVRSTTCNKNRKSNIEDHDHLSFCASDGTLIEIVRVEKNQIIKHIHNGNLIRSKYGFKTSFLASEALKCFKSLSDHSSIDIQLEKCQFDVPLCNLTEPDLQKMLDDGKTIAQVCREEIGLAI